jgi:hypothetical protein
MAAGPTLWVQEALLPTMRQLGRNHPSEVPIFFDFGPLQSAADESRPAISTRSHARANAQ